MLYQLASAIFFSAASVFLLSSVTQRVPVTFTRYIRMLQSQGCGIVFYKLYWFKFSPVKLVSPLLESPDSVLFPAYSIVVFPKRKSPTYFRTGCEEYRNWSLLKRSIPYIVSMSHVQKTSLPTFSLFTLLRGLESTCLFTLNLRSTEHYIGNMQTFESQTQSKGFVRNFNLPTVI